ncbi:hypothetical protein [Allorhizobium borbori]|uniref:Uncharacterized protein n=1 Tax=Allorhizobium borbori TaxID=485907 RepID=A0A7W6JZG4_9HYPH|nr:hypothetical protein [Allorhizobium borbori]MBB4102371.1 hypothetical protein [Allorhizobium borbori]
MKTYTQQLLEEMIADDDAPVAEKPKMKRGRKVREDRSGETPEEFRARKSEEQKERRAARAAKEAEMKTVIRTADTTRQALADAAMVLLHEGGEVAARIEALLGEVFNVQVGAPMSIRSECRTRTLKPKYLKYPPMTDAERARRIKALAM